MDNKAETLVVKQPSAAFVAVVDKLKVFQEERSSELRKCKRFDVVVKLK
jgi:hypothetical protein